MESLAKSSTSNQRQAKNIKLPDVSEIDIQSKRQITEYTSSPSKKLFTKESEKQKSSRKSITPLKSSTTADIQKKSERSHQEILETENALMTETNDHILSKKLELNQKFHHQNTGLPYDNSDRQRNLIDDLVDEKKTTQNDDSPSNKRMDLMENRQKKSIEHSKSNFVLETNKSVKSNSRSVSQKKKSDSNLNMSGSEKSNKNHKRYSISINSFSSVNEGEQTINQQIENQTLLAVLEENDFGPEAMPIYRRVSFLAEREPEFWQRLRNRNRNMIQQQQQQHDFKEACQHEEIEQWKCKECHTNISRFNHIFDDAEGRVQTPSKIVFENKFLDDFRIDFISQYNQMIQKASDKKPPSSYIIYNAYQPSNIAELREYMLYLMCKAIKKKIKRNEDYKSPFGDGLFKHLSAKLCKYIMTNDDKMKNHKKNNHLWFDSIFESGNLLQAQRSLTEPNTYNLFMQVDTNTRGHQQWFYFRVKGGEKNKEYVFKIMNFTKPGVTGGRGYKSNEYEMRIHYKSKQREKATNSEQWQYLTHDQCKCEYKKTNITRRKKDVIAAGADSDQEDWVEEAFQNQPMGAQGKPTEFVVQIPDQSPCLNHQDTGGVREKPKKRKVFYYYALVFKYRFEFDDDTVQFSFAKPITFTKIMEDIHNKERALMPKPESNQEQNQFSSPSKQMNLQFKPRSTNKKFVQSNTDQKQVREDPMDPGQDVKINPPNLLKESEFSKNLIIDNPQKLLYYQRTELCKTMSGIPLYKVIISRDYRCQKKNQIVLITSRVHSGETPGSEVFRGIFDFITSDCREARYLRRFYTFVLVPCMNPDGVICGNYRNSAAGVDLNRQWINPEQLFHPEVLSVKNLMQQIKDEDKRQIWIFCDIHGHSKKKNSFFYGCNTAANGGFLSWTIVRLLPRILAQKTHMFNYKDSRFRVEAYKGGTARVVAWKQFQITHSFTLENSFYGYEVGEGESKCFTQDDYKDIGLKFTMAIYDMHFMWKEIKRELRITQGWLKPRTLYEMTGVPLAQKVAEEAAAVKEQLRKQHAIEQYEEYLKTFYNNRSPLKRQPTFVARNTHIQQLKQDKTRNSLSNSKMLSEEIGIKEQRERRIMTNKKQTLDNGALNEDLEEAMNQDSSPEEELYYYLHKGLVKIQACFRGFLARRMVQSLMKKNQRSSTRLISNNDNVKNNFYEVGSDAGRNIPGGIQSEEVLQRSNTDQMGQPGDPVDFNLIDTSSHDTTDKNLSIFGGKTFNRPKLDWREFFHKEELDKAYQIVEVEQRDESDNNDESMGSNSNPSEDNLEEEDMYERVYGITNPKLFIQTRKKKIEMYVQKITGNLESTVSDLQENAKPKPREILSESKGILKDKELAERKNKSAFPRRSEKNVIHKNNLNQHSHDDDSYALIPLNNDSEQKHQLALNSSQKNFLRKNWQNNMMNRSSQSPIINKGEINQDNVFYHQTNQNQVQTNPVRMIQQSYLKQQSSHKKENINQVIKDCFITKKMNTKSTHSNSNNLFSKQNTGLSNVNQTNNQWAPYQNNNPSMIAAKSTGFNPANRKHLIKSQGHSVSQQNKQMYGSPKKTGQQNRPPHTAQYPDIQLHNFYPPHENMFANNHNNQDDQNSLIMHQLMANTQYQLSYNQQQQILSKQNERDMIKSSPIKHHHIGAHLHPNDQHSIPMINPPSHMNSFNSGHGNDKLPMSYMNSGLKDHFQINPQPINQSNNNLRGINSISVLQKDQMMKTPHQKMTPQYDSQEYRQGQLKVTQHQNKYIVHNNPQSSKSGNNHPKTDPIKKSKQNKHPAKVNPRSFMVTSGLITDHKEGLNSLFVTGKSEHTIPTQLGNKGKSSANSQQQQVTNLQSVRNLVEQILLGPVKLNDQQQIQLQVKNNQSNDGSGVQQFVNINQFNMFCSQSQSRENNQNNMKQMVQSSDGQIHLPNNNIVVNNKYHHNNQKQGYGASKSQNINKTQNNQPFSQQQAAQIQSLQLQQPRGALHLQQHMPTQFMQTGSIQQQQNTKNQFTIHNKFSHYGVVKNKINKLEAQDKIPVGLQSLMSGNSNPKPPVSAVSRHSTNLISQQQQQYSQQNFSKQNRPQKVFES